MTDPETIAPHEKLRASFLSYYHQDKRFFNFKIFTMKKIFLAAIIVAAAYSVSAQESVVYKTVSVNDANYIYQVPVTIRTNFQVANPNVSQVSWIPVNDWWYATYVNDDNRVTRVYYNTQPYYLEKNRDASFKVALPVLNTYVPDDVIRTAINRYGNNLFSITAKKSGENGMLSYHVTIIKNGVSEIVMMDGNNMVYNELDKTPIKHDK